MAAQSNLKYVIDGVPVKQKLNEYQYGYFQKLAAKGEKTEFAFYKAKKHRRENKRIMADSRYYDYQSYEAKLGKLAEYFKKEINRLQKIYADRTGKPYVFFLAITDGMTKELEVTILATRLGIMLEKVEKK